MYVGYKREVTRMAKRRPSGDGMVRKREDGRWEGRIVVGHKKNGTPIFQHAYAHTQNGVVHCKCSRKSPKNLLN